jgi:hypothetical protein
MAVGIAVKSIAKLSGLEEDQDQLTSKIKTTNNASAGAQTLDRGWCLLRHECAISAAATGDRFPGCVPG